MDRVNRVQQLPGQRLELERSDRFLALLDGRRARDDDGVVGAVAAPGQSEFGGRQAPRLGEFDIFPRRRRAARRAVPRLELGFKIVPRELEGPVARVPCVLVPVWKSKFYGAFVLNRRVALHAIDATPAR